jgi:hypothetical protein
MRSLTKLKSSPIAAFHFLFPTPHSPLPTPQLAIFVLFIVMLAASWQRWTQPLIDHGREMNLPTRILAGERIYNDVQVLYGPFAPHFNALLYQIFGIHLSVLKAAGAVCAILILLMIYRLARALMSEWESFLVAGLALVACALKSTANYIQPYAYGALYGLVFALGSLVATVSPNSTTALSASITTRGWRSGSARITASPPASIRPIVTTRNSATSRFSF